MRTISDMKLAPPLVCTALLLASAFVAGCDSVPFVLPGRDNPEPATTDATPTAKTATSNTAPTTSAPAQPLRPLGTLPEEAPEPVPTDVALGGETVAADYTPAEMQAAVRNFADHYRQSMAVTLDRIIVESDDPELIRRAHSAKINGSTAMYDLAVDPVPASAMLNGLVLVTLQANYLRSYGEDYFGEYYPLLQEVADRLQQEGFRLAARAMTEQQRIDLRATIDQWAQANPEVRDFWYVRLDDLPGLADDPDVFNTFTNLPRNFLNIFNPFADAGESVSEAQVLAERMSWLAPRLMILAQWRAEAIVYNSIANTRLNEVVDLGNRITAVAEELPETLAAQREGLFNDLEENHDTLESLVTTTDQFTQNATALLEAADVIAQRIITIQDTAYANAPPPDPNEPPGRPFDVTEYTEALTELNQVLIDLNELVVNVDAAASADAIDARLGVVEGSVRGLIFTTAFAFLIVGLLLILAAKFIPARLGVRNKT
ncbi:MAG: hypothetical protein AAF593_06180 [Planctomycetota bacterium]